jgi:hypothetical protein
MKTVTLLPHTKRLKQLIKEYGEQWTELYRLKAQCFNGMLGVMIESKDGKHTRWVLPINVREGGVPTNE